MNVLRKFISIDSFNIGYRQWGVTGKPVILLHGIPMNSVLWNLVGDNLAQKGYHVFAPELLGLGYTEGPTDFDHSLKGQAKILNLFIDNIVKEDYLLVGHDLGGGISQIMITEYADKIRKCVLTNCVAFDSWPIKEIKFLIKLATRNNYTQVITPAFILDFLSKGIASGLTNSSILSNEILKDIHSGLTGSTGRYEHFIKFLLAMDNRYTQEASLKLSSYVKPVLIIWAKDDKYQPISVGERLRNALPDATWKKIDGLHFHPLESTEISESIFEWDI